MRYRYYLILFIICVLSTDVALAQDTRYRVELLVLTHLQFGQEPEELKRLEDFTSAVDFLTPPEEEDDEEGIEEEVESGQGQEAIDAAEDLTVTEEPDPNALVHIEEMSDVMQDAWRRLRLSAPFRPEQYLSWEQGNQEPFPALRVHDLQVVMVADPYAELRLEQALEEAKNETQPTVFADAAGLDALEGEGEPELPDPTLYYRLDGTVTLKRTRFLHLGLNLQLREAVWEEEIPVLDEADEPEFAQPVPSSFLVHDLQQSRQVKTGRMEYFDGPVLSVLAYITSVRVDDELPP
jgi:hypothetical protein